jgi:SAM-dependent methyltransferase
VTEDPRRRFTATAEDYRNYRPTYPSALLDFILSTASLSRGARIADVGCGTGIASRLLARRGYEVVGIDANEAMLQQARTEPVCRYVRAEATATGLRSGAVDLVTVAQAFHWFPVEPTLAEFRRILGHAGACAVFWNRRASSPFMDAYDSILRSHVEGFGKIPRPEEASKKLSACSMVQDSAEGSFPHVQRLDLPALLGRAHSSSYVVHEVSDRDSLDGELRRLFETYREEDGAVSFAYTAAALVFRIA